VSPVKYELGFYIPEDKFFRYSNSYTYFQMNWKEITDSFMVQATVLSVPQTA
jgi:hypothetical protein